MEGNIESPLDLDFGPSEFTWTDGIPSNIHMFL